LRLLPAFIIKRRDVAEFLAKFEAVLAQQQSRWRSLDQNTKNQNACAAI
jgi:hypothetical protein